MSQQTSPQQNDGPPPGDRADTPTEIPARGWWQVIRRAVRESSADHVPPTSSARS